MKKGFRDLACANEDIAYVEYVILILTKVSFDKKLFWKEYRKSKTLLNEEEIFLVQIWVIRKLDLKGRVALRALKTFKVNQMIFEKRILDQYPALRITIDSSFRP